MAEFDIDPRDRVHPKGPVIDDVLDAQVALGGVIELLTAGVMVDRSGLETILRLIEERLDRASEALQKPE